MIAKLFLITRRDLVPGQQAVQATHAAIEFVMRHPETAGSWYRDSNTLAFLSVPDEASLDRIASTARELGASVSEFREPDIGDRLTAVAIEPGRAGRRACSGLPLALKEVERNMGG